MPFDQKKYIDSLDLDDAQKAVMQQIFAKEKNVAEMNRGYAARDEASRLMDEGTKAKTDAEAIKQASAAEKADADRIKAEAEAELTKNRGWADALKKYETDTQQTATEKAELEVKAQAYENYLKTIGVEPAFALEGVDLPKAKPPAPRQEPPVPAPIAAPVIDEEMLAKLGYAKREEVGRAATLLANLPFELNDVNARHRELYGKDAPATELKKVREAFLNEQNTRALSEIAAESFHFEDRQKELDEIAINERVNKQAEEMFTKRMSELQLPGSSIDAIAANRGGIDETTLKFASKGFADNAKRSSSNDAGVSAEEMAMFMEADAELATKGIRPTPFG